MAVAHPCDDVSLRGAVEAKRLRLIEPILVGPAERMRGVAAQAGLDIAAMEIVTSEHSHDSAAKAVELVNGRQGRGADEGQPAHRRIDGRRGRRGNPAFAPRAGSAIASSWTCRAIPSR